MPLPGSEGVRGEAERGCLSQRSSLLSPRTGRLIGPSPFRNGLDQWLSTWGLFCHLLPPWVIWKYLEKSLVVKILEVSLAPRGQTPEKQVNILQGTGQPLTDNKEFSGPKCQECPD